jgi:hypothetical protein
LVVHAFGDDPDLLARLERVGLEDAAALFHGHVINELVVSVHLSPVTLNVASEVLAR